MPNRYVLDSYALIGYLENEHFADRIEQLLKQAKKGGAGLYLRALVGGGPKNLDNVLSCESA
jgi:hypothetical protein